MAVGVLFHMCCVIPLSLFSSLFSFVFPMCFALALFCFSYPYALEKCSVTSVSALLCDSLIYCFKIPLFPLGACFKSSHSSSLSSFQHLVPLCNAALVFYCCPPFY